MTAKNEQFTSFRIAIYHKVRVILIFILKFWLQFGIASEVDSTLTGGLLLPVPTGNLSNDQSYNEDLFQCSTHVWMQG